MPEMKLPGPEHPITIAYHPKRVQVEYQNHTIADTRRALVLTEAGYKPVLYIPRDDIDMAYFTRTERHTHCPYKGEASYFTLMMDGVFAENACWSYEDPYPAMQQIKDRIAFYPNQVTVHELDAVADPDRVRDAILHTDDGAGTSQREHWPPSEATPPADALDRPYKDTGAI
ncbi:MAG TPA: DUF427 domain-containing protein [Caulobacteraceae bacterium]|nr:DUF427 domain-containing protein [Caulobacteraceae bacterium]